MKQTAVEWLFNQIKKSSEKKDNINNDHLFFYRMLEQAKQMERQEIKDAWDDAYDKGTRDRIEKISNPVGNAEQYYNETFKSE